MQIDLFDTGIDPHDEQYRTFLESLQGNILKSHGREYTRLIFLSFDCDPLAICDWLGLLASVKLVTSAWEQHRQARKYHKGVGPGKTFCSVLLSADGYLNLGIKEKDLPRLFNEAPDGDDFPKVHFRDGMAAAREQLMDPSRSRWHAKYRGAFDAMVLLADDDPDRLCDVSIRIRNSLVGVSGMVHEEQGRTLRNITGHSIEYFGNVDGVSQPLFFRHDLARARKLHGATTWDPSAPLALVLLPDPLAQSENAFGSYMVYRKLEQDVEGYTTMKGKLAKAINQAKPNKELAGAMIIGRFEDGTPVVLDKRAHGEPINNFDYSQDLYGRRCPFQAHIRKANPRGGTATGLPGKHRHSEPGLPPRDGAAFAAEKAHRIARRGVPYEDADGSKGLLFMCYQRDISRQFAFIQRKWANNIDFLKPQTGIDALIGEAYDGPPPVPPQNWPTAWGGEQTIDFDFHGFVTLRGGEFFFAPSIPFLAHAKECLEQCGVTFDPDHQPHHLSPEAGVPE